jgi:hypothetical protein
MDYWQQYWEKNGEEINARRRERLANNPTYRARVRQLGRENYYRHKEARLAASLAYAKTENGKKAFKKYRKNNKEWYREYYKSYRLKNREHLLECRRQNYIKRLLP